MNLWTRLWWAIEFVPFSVIWSWWDLCPAPSSLVLVLRRHHNQKYILSCVSPILRWVSRLLFNGISQGKSADIGTSNFLRATFIVSLNLHRLLQWSIFLSILWHCRALIRCVRHVFPIIFWTKFKYRSNAENRGRSVKVSKEKLCRSGKIFITFVQDIISLDITRFRHMRHKWHESEVRMEEREIKERIKFSTQTLIPFSRPKMWLLHPFKISKILYFPREWCSV